MTYFNVGLITSELKIDNYKLPAGAHTSTAIITGIPEKQKDGDIHFKVYVNYNHYVNNISVLRLAVTTTYLIVGFDYNNIEKEIPFIKFLLIKTFAHTQAVLATKFADEKEYIRIPDEPDYTSPTEEAKKRLIALT